jgi:hypothetical protein
LAEDGDLAGPGFADLPFADWTEIPEDGTRE